MREVNITGNKYGRLIAVSVGSKNQYWIFNCTCGKSKEIYKHNVLSGKVKSCGCINIEEIKKIATTHGLSKHPLYIVWTEMNKRCYNKKVINYERYGGVGVTVCDEWRSSFVLFYNWAIANGWAKGLQLDKDIKAKEAGLKPNLYSPERCQFVTPLINNQSRRLPVYEHNGISLSVSGWAKEFGMTAGAVSNRIQKGWSMGRIANTPFKKYKS